MSQTGYPRVEIDRAKLRHNARTILTTCREYGIDVTGVTKVVCAHPSVARALITEGFSSLGDSRLRNLRRLRKIDPDVQLMLLRLPPPSRADEVVQWADVSLNSEPDVLQSLNCAAARAGVIHEVLLMVDLGDLREGLWQDELADACRLLSRLDNIRLAGIGTNLACYGGVRPSPDNMAELLDCCEVVRDVLGCDPRIISGGNSANWQLLEQGQMPLGINHLRIGEALLLGNETVDRRPISGMHDDTFTLCCEVIETRRKPSTPIGELGQDAFGNVPEFTDRGWHQRAIVAVGRQDIVPEGLRPEMEGVRILGASSDHMILDVEDASGKVEVGDVLRFTVRSYSCVLAAFTSDYVAKRPV